VIFSGEHIDKIARGEKTMTRRESSRYMVGRTYAVQPGRGKAGLFRIRVTHKWLEKRGQPIHPVDAYDEGGYTPEQFEELYESLHPGWGERWAYEFVVEV